MRKTTVVLKEDTSDFAYSVMPNDGACGDEGIGPTNDRIDPAPQRVMYASLSVESLSSIDNGLNTETVVETSIATSGEEGDRIGVQKDGEFAVQRRAPKKEDNKELLEKLKQRAIEGQEDVFSDLRFLKESVSEFEKLAPIMRALLYKPGSAADARDRTAAFRGLIQASLVYSQKYVSMCARSLKITAQEKRMEMQRVIPWMSEMIANAWVLSGPDDLSIPSLDDVLKSAYGSRRDVDRIVSALGYQGVDLEQSSEDLNKFLLKGSIQQAMAPLAAEIAYMNDSKDPKDSADLLEVFKNYLVKDISVFLTNMTSEHLKIGEAAKIEAVKSRIKQISTILLSDLRANFELTGKMPKKEELIKERLPVVRGIVYQLDAMVDSAMSGIRLSVIAKEDLKAEEKAEVVQLKTSEQEARSVEKLKTPDNPASTLDNRVDDSGLGVPAKVSNKGGPTL